MRNDLMFAAVGILGLLIGLSASGMMQQEGDYCNSIEQDLKDNRSFNGSISCYPPGVLDANLSERVDQKTEHKCTCRIIDRSGIRLFPVAVSD